MSKKIETFVPIRGFEGLYEISNHGRVRSSECMCENSRGEIYIRSSKIMYTRIDTRGHGYVNLRKNGKCITRRNHALVIEHFPN